MGWSWRGVGKASVINVLIIIGGSRDIGYGCWDSNWRFNKLFNTAEVSNRKSVNSGKTWGREVGDTDEINLHLSVGSQKTLSKKAVKPQTLMSNLKDCWDIPKGLETNIFKELPLKSKLVCWKDGAANSSWSALLFDFLTTCISCFDSIK